MKTKNKVNDTETQIKLDFKPSEIAEDSFQTNIKGSVIKEAKVIEFNPRQEIYNKILNRRME